MQRGPSRSLRPCPLSGARRHPVEIVDRLFQHRYRYNREGREGTNVLRCVRPVAIVGHVGFGLGDWIELPAVDMTKWWLVAKTNRPLDQMVRNDLGHRVANLILLHVGDVPQWFAVHV